MLQKKKSGSAQKALDTWLQDSWTPTIEKDKKIKEVNSNKDREFKLQEYIDKIGIYLKENNSSTEESHLKRLNAMPVIGK